MTPKQKAKQSLTDDMPKTKGFIFFIKSQNDTFHEVVLDKCDEELMWSIIARFHGGVIQCVEKPSKIVLGKRKKITNNE